MMIELPQHVLDAIDRYLTIDWTKQATNIGALNQTSYVGEQVIALVQNQRETDRLATIEAQTISNQREADQLAAIKNKRAFFAERSPGDRISWGVGRAGVIQNIEDDYVTVLDDGWKGSPQSRYQPPFVTRLAIELLFDPTPVKGGTLK